MRIAVDLSRNGARPRWLIDALIAVAVSVPGIVYATLAAEQPVLTVSLLVAASLALIWRRRASLAVLVVVSVLAAVAEPQCFVLVLGLAIFEVATRCTIGGAVLGYAIAVLLPLAGMTIRVALGVPPAAMPDAAPSIGLGATVVDPYLILALAVGIILQSRRERARVQETLVEERIEHARALERSRMAAEMHDIVGHALTVMISLGHGALMTLRDDPERAEQALRSQSAAGASAVAELQRTLQILRDADQVLDDALESSGYDLPALDEMIATFRAVGLPVSLTMTGEPLPGDVQLRLTVHRIVQEALTNALRYAENATRVDVAVAYERSVITIDVIDDGSAAEQPASVGTECGLIGVAERAALYGGTSAAGPRRPHGWELRAVLRYEERP